jgi:hypothetical protein
MRARSLLRPHQRQRNSHVLRSGGEIAVDHQLSIFRGQLVPVPVIDVDPGIVDKDIVAVAEAADDERSDAEPDLESRLRCGHPAALKPLIPNINPHNRRSAGVPPLEQTVQTLDFVEHHRPALERDEVRHNVILANLGRLALEHPPILLRWTLGAPGACAVQTPGYPIVLGEFALSQCRALADETRDLDYPDVVGPDRTAQWFAQRAIELGLTFLEPIPQQIHVLTDKPNYPGGPGDARVRRRRPVTLRLFSDEIPPPAFRGGNPSKRKPLSPA